MIERWQKGEVVSSLKCFRVVNLTGARQCGKTTLAGMVPLSCAKRFTLDDDETRKAAKSDPYGFVARADGETVVIDEIQVCVATTESIPRVNLKLFLGLDAHVVHIAAVRTIVVEKIITAILKNDLCVVARHSLRPDPQHVSFMPSDGHLGLLCIHVSIKSLVILITIDNSRHGRFSLKWAPVSTPFMPGKTISF